MDNATSRNPHHLRRNRPRHRSWCCSFTVPPHSPENQAISRPKPANKPETPSKYAASFPNSPQSTKLGLVGRIDPRRILSPGRVSPIDSQTDLDDALHEAVISEPPRVSAANLPSRSNSLRRLPPKEAASASKSGLKDDDNGCLGAFDVRLNLKGKTGGSLVLELSSEVLSENSSVFADLIADHRRKRSSSSSRNLCRIEVPDVDNLNVFRETIELMFEEDITRRLLKIGVYRSIDILEVSSGIMFTKGVSSCLKYLEAVPWTEEEEEKLRSLFSRSIFDDTTTSDILARLYPMDPSTQQQDLATQLVWSITTCNDTNAKNELKSLVKGLFSKSSVYEKDNQDINRENLYNITRSCLTSLVDLLLTNYEDKQQPLVQRISKQVDNINWVVEIMLDRQMAEEFVDIWKDQAELLKMHETASPMVRYELSRVSAMLFIALGTRKLQCRSEARLGLFQAWFGPMLSDFGWLQRCRKGLDVRALEDAMGQTLLTLPLKEQYILFMEWFRFFSKHGTECPNLGKAFQIWWRRSFLRGSESHAIESR
ncbi:BTB/POZ domain-containing protein At2g13690 [Impatiens glandulifera]|uniref:BTB/POZ domain-containing protein At2g13690 n=1 Tax=Impatiens glandulifera TaxID=253017 RepID=UPI001FB19C8E|nr:BTB/POZ domain-containing protein At2g13690 [Impatiens glandulifera]